MNSAKKLKTPMVKTNFSAAAFFSVASALGVICTNRNVLISSLWTLFQRFVRAISNHARLFQRDQPAFHHFVQHRQELVDVLLSVHNLDHERQVEREP